MFPCKLIIRICCYVKITTSPWLVWVFPFSVCRLSYGYYMAAQRYKISPWVLKNIAYSRNIFQQEKRNFVSLSSHVIFYLSHKHQWNTKSFHFNVYFFFKVEHVFTKKWKECMASKGWKKYKLHFCYNVIKGFYPKIHVPVIRIFSNMIKAQLSKVLLWQVQFLCYHSNIDLFNSWIARIRKSEL